MTIHAHTLVRRQTPQSAFSHFTTFSKVSPERRFALLCGLIGEAIRKGDYSASPAKDALVVDVQPFGEAFAFMTPIAPIGALPPTVQFETYITRRAEGEASYLCTHANIYGSMSEVKTTAQSCQVILYLRDYYGDYGAMDAVRDGFDARDWDLVSLNASPTASPTPQHPESMARNQLGLIGGSDAVYTPEQWAKSVHYWGCHVRLRSAEPATLGDAQYWGDIP